MRFSVVFSSVLILVLLASCNFEPARSNVYIVTSGLDYANTNITTLGGTIRDCLEVSSCLKQTYEVAGYKTEVINMLCQGQFSDEQSSLYPTAENILKTIQNIPCTENDLIVFFFSGHGLSGGGDSFFACAKEGQQPYTQLWMEDLFSAFEGKGCPCVILADCCYSGFLALNGDPECSFSNAVSEIFKSKTFSNVSVICSSGTDEKSSESVVVTEDGFIERHGFFTLRLLDALGWVHTYEGGYLENPKQHMSIQKLYRQISGNWSSEKQFPITNNNTIGVNLIP